MNRSNVQAMGGRSMLNAWAKIDAKGDLTRSDTEW